MGARLAALASLAATAACFSPTFPNGAACGEDGFCPGNQTCVDGVCLDDGSQIDAATVDSGPAIDAALCGWPFDPAHFDPCTDPLDAEPLIVTTPTTYNTTTGAFSGSGLSAASSVVGGVRVMWVSFMAIDEEGSVRVAGDMPLMIVATSDIDVQGMIDAASSLTNIGAGASSDSERCATPAEPGVMCDQHGASGGGGGGFGSSGSGGDSGASTLNCGADVGAPPTAGGPAVAVPTTIRAGCAGAPGQFTLSGNDGDQGVGGPGGGAVFLSAAGTLAIRGVISAGGAGGGGAQGDRASGGGGGSGGYIGLEASELEIGSAAILAANGGGGGGGSGGDIAEDGQRGLAVSSPAPGGLADGAGGGDGNDGATAEVEAETPSTDVQRGGGGGGGGVGFILIYNRGTLEIETGALITPLPIEM